MDPTSPLDSYCLCYLLAPFKRIEETGGGRGTKRTDEGRRLSRIPPLFEPKKLNKQTSWTRAGPRSFDSWTLLPKQKSETQRERKIKVSDRMSAIKKNWKATSTSCERNRVPGGQVKYRHVCIGNARAVGAPAGIYSTAHVQRSRLFDKVCAVVTFNTAIFSLSKINGAPIVFAFGSPVIWSFSFFFLSHFLLGERERLGWLFVVLLRLPPS